MRLYITIVVILVPILASAQAIQKHGPDEVYFTNDLIEGRQGRIFLSTTGGLYYTDNKGDSWERPDDPMNSVYFHPKFSKNKTTDALLAWDENHGVYETLDNGQTWNPLFLILPDGDKQIKALAAEGDTVLAGTSQGLKYFIGDDVLRFANEFDALKGQPITSLVMSGRKIYCGTTNGLLFSSDGGSSWNSRSEGLPEGYSIKGIVSEEDVLIIYSQFQGIYVSNDDGITWQARNTGFTSDQVNDVFLNGTDLYAATNSYDKVYKSTLNGEDWILIDNGIPDGVSAETILFSDDTLLLGGWHGVYRSLNGGDTWITAANGITDAFVFKNLITAPDGSIWAIGSHTGVYRMEKGGNEFEFLEKGTNYGCTRLINDSIPVLTPYVLRFYDTGDRQFNSEVIYHNLVFADRVVISQDGIMMSSHHEGGIVKLDETTGWIPVNAGLGSMSIVDFIFSGNKYFAATEEGLYRMDLGGNEWSRVPFASNGVGCYGLFAEGDLMIVSATDWQSYISKDGGATWNKLVHLPSGSFVFTHHENVLYAANGNELFISGDAGNSWGKRPLPVVVSAMEVFDGRLYIATLERGIWSTTPKLDQVVHFVSAPENVFVDDTFELVASSTSELPVTFSLVAGPASITGNIITIKDEGEIVVKASQEGNSVFNGATADLVLRASYVTAVSGEHPELISVYPNPARDIINVVLHGQQNEAPVALVDLRGSKVVESRVLDPQQAVQLDVSHLEKGMYILRFNVGSRLITRKVVID